MVGKAQAVLEQVGNAVEPKREERLEGALPLRASGTQSALPANRGGPRLYSRRSRFCALRPLRQPIVLPGPQYHLFGAPGGYFGDVFVFREHFSLRLPARS